MSITIDIQKRVAAIEIELASIIKERFDVIHGLLVARVAHQHLVMLGPGGTAKSLLIREFVRRVDGAVYFEKGLDETTDPGEVFGPPDIKGMVELGKTRRITDGMLPEATDAFLDELFNSNGPVLHSLQPIMNERLFHNGGLPTNVPLRSLFAGTNKLNADADLAPFFDRLHLRYTVDYVKNRQNQMDMVAEAIARKALGAGAVNSLATAPTTVTVDELDIAHQEALALNINDEVFNTFLDIRDELRADGGIVVSDRRMVEGMAAVLANAWVRGHEDVQIADLDVLANMWWSLQEQIPKAQDIVLGVANPNAKMALDLMSTLDQIKTEFEGSQKEDDTVRDRVAVEAIRNTKQVVREAGELLAVATASGADTSRLTDVISQADSFKDHVEFVVYGTEPTR